MCPEDKTSIVGNCALISLCFVLICLIIVCLFIVPFDEAHQEQWLGMGEMGLISIVAIIYQIFIIRKKLAIRKEEEKDIFQDHNL